MALQERTKGWLLIGLAVLVYVTGQVVIWHMIAVGSSR